MNCLLADVITVDFSAYDAFFLFNLPPGTRVVTFYSFLDEIPQNLYQVRDSEIIILGTVRLAAPAQQQKLSANSNKIFVRLANVPPLHSAFVGI